MKYGLRPDANDIAVGISGNSSWPRTARSRSTYRSDLAPRTAIGFDADGSRMIMLTVDGRATGSRGMSLKEMGQLMVGLGADDALNLDGGGSSTMLARTPGEAAAEVVNDPSDGGERLIPNGLGLLPVKGIRPADRASASRPPARRPSERHRRLRAAPACSPG